MGQTEAEEGQLAAERQAEERPKRWQKQKAWMLCGATVQTRSAPKPCHLVGSWPLAEDAAAQEVRAAQNYLQPKKYMYNPRSFWIPLSVWCSPVFALVALTALDMQFLIKTEIQCWSVL
jgi:hypothetical protein